MGAYIMKDGCHEVPVGATAIHVHPSRDLLEKLGISMTLFKELSQPNQFAANEKVEIASLENSDNRLTWLPARLLGPARVETQVEVSKSDARRMKLNVPVRSSGDLQGTPGCLIRYNNKIIAINRGVIVSKRHVHLSVDDAVKYQLKDKDTVDVIILSEERGETVLRDVLVRSGPEHETELHLDVDEANAFGLC